MLYIIKIVLPIWYQTTTLAKETAPAGAAVTIMEVIGKAAVKRRKGKKP